MKSLRVCVRYQPIIIENLSKHAWMTIEEIFVQYGIIISERFCKTWQSSGRNLFECCFVGFMTNSTHVEHHSVLRITQDIIHAFLLLIMLCLFSVATSFVHPNVHDLFLFRIFLLSSYITYNTITSPTSCCDTLSFQFACYYTKTTAIDTMTPRHTIKSTATGFPFGVRKQHERRRRTQATTTDERTMLRLWKCERVLRQMWTIKNPFAHFFTW